MAKYTSASQASRNDGKGRSKGGDSSPHPYDPECDSAQEKAQRASEKPKRDSWLELKTRKGF